MIFFIFYLIFYLFILYFIRQKVWCFLDIPFDILYNILFGIFFGILFDLSIFWPFFRIFSFIFSGTLSGVLMAYLLAFYLAVEGRRAHWAHRVPVWCTWNEVRGPSVPTQVGNQNLLSSIVQCGQTLPVGVQPCPLRAAVGELGKELARQKSTWKWKQRWWRRSKKRKKRKTCLWSNIKIQSINNKKCINIHI